MNSESDESPNHALQRTPGFGVQLPSAAVVRPAQSRAVLPAMKPSTARAFASRRRAHSRAPGPESLSLGSLGIATHVVFSAAIFRVLANLMSATLYPVVAPPSRTPTPARHHLSPLAVHS